MATTTGMPTVVAALTDAVADVQPASAVRAPRRPAFPWVLLSADVGAAAATAVFGVAALPAAWNTTAHQALVVLWPVVVASCGGLVAAPASTDAVRVRALLRAASLTALALWAAVAISPSSLRGGTVVAARSTLVLVVSLLLLSVLLRLLSGRLHSAPTRVVLAGDASGVRSLLSEARRAAASGRARLVPVAVCLHDQQAAPPDDLVAAAEGLTIWSTTDDLVDVIRLHRADAVVVAPGSGIGHAELRRWAAWLQDSGAALLVSSGLRDVEPRRLELSAIGGVRLLSVRPAPITGPSHLVKGAADRVAAALLLVVLAPLLLVLVVLVRRDSPGKALYAQTRTGRHGNPFTVYKLRTMCADADRLAEELVDVNESDRDGVLFKIRRDPRITRTGAVLRKYSLDELPQLLNVLRGEMSLIGPRPALPSEVRAYGPDVERRLAVKPGLTGLWQVSGRSDLSWEDTVRLDLQYVDNWSWSLDLRIAWKTFGAVIGHKGAY
jgi:exopolysaccharide biosynthesis polyprenyl glycosylphosphotransferase